jgi:hypothetical protein
MQRIDEAISQIQDLLHLQPYGCGNQFAIEEIQPYLLSIQLEGGADARISDDLSSIRSLVPKLYGARGWQSSRTQSSRGDDHIKSKIYRYLHDISTRAGILQNQHRSAGEGDA